MDDNYMAGSCKFHFCWSHDFNSRMFVSSRTRMIYNVSYVIQPILCYNILQESRKKRKNSTSHDIKD